jgi:hypothetical protein
MFLPEKISMNMSLYKQLTAFLLLVSMLFVPINSIAQEVKSGALMDTRTCQLLPTDYGASGRGGQSDNYPDKGSQL